MKPVISVEELSVRFRTPKKEAGLAGAVKSFWHREYTEKFAVHDVSFTIDPGEFVGFIGPNGAGKTSTLKTLSGLLYPTSGQVRVLGQVPFERKPEFLQHIALVMGQKNQLLWDLPATDSFLLSKAVYNIGDNDYKKTSKELIELLEVGDQLQTPVRKLSLGQRMKMELIAALLHRPQVLYLDEPSIGLDVMVQRNLRDFIKAYNQETGATIMLTSHYMGDVKELCSRVLVISNGQLAFDGSLEALMAEHSPTTLIKMVFTKAVSRAKLQALGEIDHWEPPNASLLVPRQEATKRAAQLLQTFPVADISLEETPIEDIIRDLFHRL